MSYDGLPKISVRDAVARLNVSHSTLNRILKDCSNIERTIMENEIGSRKRKRARKEEVVDKVLKEWFLQVRKKMYVLMVNFNVKKQNGEKHKLMVIGNPRCFKGVKTLPVDYKANKSAWMTAVIFKDWLIK